MTEREYFIVKAIREQQAINWFAYNKLMQQVYVHTEAMEDKYAPFDNWMYSGATESVVEIKVRTNKTSKEIDYWGGACLEFKKFERIRQHLEEKGIEPDTLPVYYFCFFKDCLRIYQLPMNPLMYKWYPKMYQKNDFNKKHKVCKIVADLSQNNLIETVYYG